MDSCEEGDNNSSSTRRKSRRKKTKKRVKTVNQRLKKLVPDLIYQVCWEVNLFYELILIRLNNIK